MKYIPFVTLFLSCPVTLDDRFVERTARSRQPQSSRTADTIATIEDISDEVKFTPFL